MQTQHLEWDTDVLGIKVAKIVPTRCDLPTLESSLGELKEQGVKLVYWASHSEDSDSQRAAEKCRGFLADRKITYAIDLKTLPFNPLIAEEVEIYEQPSPTVELEQLALQSGSYSRFKIDPNISQAQFEKIYKTWMANSTKKEIAERVLVAKVKNKMAGMVTLGEKNHRADIGLLAVSEEFRGMKLGTKLVVATLYTFIQQEFSSAQVVSQLANIPACKLYESCHFKKEKVENFYHFWM